VGLPGRGCRATRVGGRGTVASGEVRWRGPFGQHEPQRVRRSRLACVVGTTAGAQSSGSVASGEVRWQQQLRQREP
jgi:hypothetical protein